MQTISGPLFGWRLTSVQDGRKFVSEWTTACAQLFVNNVTLYGLWETRYGG